MHHFKWVVRIFRNPADTDGSGDLMNRRHLLTGFKSANNKERHLIHIVRRGPSPKALKRSFQ